MPNAAAAAAAENKAASEIKIVNMVYIYIFLRENATRNLQSRRPRNQNMLTAAKWRLPHLLGMARLRLQYPRAGKPNWSASWSAQAAALFLHTNKPTNKRHQRQKKKPYNNCDKCYQTVISPADCLGQRVRPLHIGHKVNDELGNKFTKTNLLSFNVQLY